MKNYLLICCNKFKNKKKLLFYIVSLICLLIFFISAIVTHGYSLKRYLSGFDNDSFVDFYNMLRANRLENRNTRYLSGTIYPPLANLCFMIMSMALPDSIRSDFVINQYTMMIFFLYNVILFFAFFIVVTSWKKGDIKERLIFLGIMLFSVPFIFMYERGNIIFLSLILCLIFFLWKDSENKLLRELSFIALALSAGIKIYPAIFGFLLVKEKRIRESLRLLLYGVAAFFLPSIVYGKNTLLSLINNLFVGSNNNGLGRVGNKLAFSETIYYVCDLYNIERHKETIVSIITVLIILGAVLSFFYLDEKWKEILLLSCLLIGIPKISFTYTGIFLIIPLTALLDSKSSKHQDYFYLISIMLAMLPLPFAFTEGINIPLYSSMYRTISVNVESFSILIITLRLIGEGVCRFLLKLSKSHRNAAILIMCTCIALYSGMTFYKQSDEPYLTNNYNRFTANDNFVLSENQTCSQTFVAKEDELTNMVIRLGMIKCDSILMEISELDSENVIYRQIISKQTADQPLQQYALNRVTLDNVRLKVGNEYKISLSAMGGGEKSLTLYHTVEGYVFKDAYAIVNNEKKPYCIDINLYEK